METLHREQVTFFNDFKRMNKWGKITLGLSIAVMFVGTLLWSGIIPMAISDNVSDYDKDFFNSGISSRPDGIIWWSVHEGTNPDTYGFDGTDGHVSNTAMFDGDHSTWVGSYGRETYGSGGDGDSSLNLINAQVKVYADNYNEVGSSGMVSIQIDFLGGIW